MQAFVLKVHNPQTMGLETCFACDIPAFLSSLLGVCLCGVPVRTRGITTENATQMKRNHLIAVATTARATAGYDTPAIMLHATEFAANGTW